MSQEPPRMVCIACSVFRGELESLRTTGEFSFSVHYLDSILHGDADELRRRIDRLLNDELERGKKVLLLYGGCHSHISDQESVPGVVRVRGLNCAEILLGHDEYRTLRRDGVFFLLPEWAQRCPDMLQSHLGMHGENARALMNDMHTKLLYLDTGLTPVPTEDLRATSDYAGLPWEVTRVTCEHLKAAIKEAIERMAQDEH